MSSLSSLPRKVWRFTVVSLLLTCWTLSVSADEGEASGEWEKYFEVYGWLPNIYIAASDDSHVTLTLSDLLKNLDMLGFVDFGAKKNKWSFGIDSVYMNLGKRITREGVLPGSEINTKIDMRSFFSTAHVGYQVAGDDASPMSVIGGVRYLYLRGSPEFDFDNIGDRKILKTGNNWSGVIGLEGQKTLNEKWYLDYYADIGAGGQTDLTWQARLGGGYRFNKFTATFGFRYLRWNFDGSGSLENLRVIGPQVGARWTF